MRRLTENEKKRVSSLCLWAWNKWLIDRSKMVSVPLEDIELLLRAGAVRTSYGKIGPKWRVEVDLYGHAFLFEDEYYFFVPETASGLG